MRIVHVSVGALPPVFSSHGGAIQRRVAELAREQVRRGHVVDVFSPALRDGARHVEGISVTYVQCRLRQPWAHFEYQLRVLYRLAAKRGQRADVIHFHSEPEGALLTAGLATKRVLSYDNFYFRGGYARRLCRIYRRALKVFDVLLPCSEYCRRASAEYWGIDPARMTTCYNGVDTDVFRPDDNAGCAERQRLGVSRPVILYVGRICRQKGSDTLLAAYRRIRAKHPDTTLVLVGPFEQFDGHDLAAARAWQESIAAAGAIHLGSVSDEQLPRLYNAADVFVMPTAELEMFGMAALEAEACGVPVVASDHGGLRETVPIECGARVPPGNAVALAEAVEALLADDARRLTCGAAARAHALRFAWPRVVADLDKIYARGR
jgi:glycosyltransferase involved in cell wall biosynthesis